MGKYRSTLACGEPADSAIEEFPVTFKYWYTAADEDDRVTTGNEPIAFDGQTYVRNINSVGPPQRFPA
jgi:hypothetical protein